ncbi:MAG: phosphoglucosamine mutase, partial [Halanaerobiales bacterium]
MGKMFGTDGVRGVANKELTGEMAYKLGRAGGYYLTKNYSRGKRKPLMIIGKDTRVSGDMLEAALTAGMTSAGIDVIKLGIIPTPGVSYLASTLDVDGAVMISASHNPIADNGIKFFTNEGYKLTDEMEADIENLILNDYGSIPSPTSINIGNIEKTDDLVIKYIDYLISTVDVDLSDLKIVLDCANGAAYRVATEVLEQLGAELIVINNHPAGDKIN